MHWLIWLVIVIIIILIVFWIIGFAYFKTGTFDIFAKVGGDLSLSIQPYSKYVTVSGKSHIEDVTKTGFALKHNNDEVTIHGKSDFPIKFRRKDFVNGKLTSDKTITIKSDYHLRLIEEGKDSNVDIFIEFLSLGNGT